MAGSGFTWGRRTVALVVVVGLIAVVAPPSGAATTWFIQPSPNRAGVYNSLNDVSCSSGAHCVAVGRNRSYNLGGPPRGGTLVETFSGGKWSMTASPQGLSRSLSAVSCPTTNRCYAVGQGSDRPLIVTSAGGPWSVMASPSIGLSSELVDISCTDATQCVAVGSTGSANRRHTLVMTLAGGVWSVTPSPNHGTKHDNRLTGVSCTGSTACVAVGAWQGANFDRTLAMQLSDGTWSLMNVPNRNADPNVLSGVACTSATSCVAVGNSLGNATGTITVHQTLIESMSAGVWKMIRSPNVGPSANELDDVACTDTAHCTAVGRTDQSDLAHAGQTLVATVRSGVWSVEPSPSRATGGWGADMLHGVDCVSAGCVAAGSSPRPIPSTVSRTLVIRRPGS